MSNKPKIHAFCAAGCKWETVHMSDFLKSATFYEVGQPDGVATVDAYRKYRIFSDSNTNTGKYTASIEFQSPDATGEVYETQTTFSVSTGYRGYFDFEVMQARYSIDKGETAQIQIFYEVNGEQKTFTGEVKNLDLTKSVLKITGANQVLIYNDTAAILGKDGGYYTPSVKDNKNGTMTISFAPSEEGMPAVTPVTYTVGGGGGSSDSSAVVVEIGGDVATHSASDIFAFVQAGRVVVALVNGRYCYQYREAVAYADEIASCVFIYTEVDAQRGAVVTHGVTIDNNHDATLWDEEFIGGGGNTMTDTETGISYTLSVVNGKLTLTQVK